MFDADEMRSSGNLYLLLDGQTRNPGTRIPGSRSISRMDANRVTGKPVRVMMPGRKKDQDTGGTQSEPKRPEVQPTDPEVKPMIPDKGRKKGGSKKPGKERE